MTDKNDVTIKDGSIINIHQTVNGENLFVILDINELDIRYCRDITIKYEYDKYELIGANEHYGESMVEVVGNIYKYINSYR